MPARTKQEVHSKRIISPQIPSDTTKRSRDLYLWGTFTVILLLSLIRWRLINVPLERDEGEYAYMGRLILNGLMPYKHAYNMKLPGVYFMYALFMGIFGQTIEGIHTGFLFMNAATMLFFYLALRDLYRPSIAFFASSVYGLMAVSGSFVGFAAHATHFVSFFLAIGILFLSNFYNRQRIHFAFLAGLMFGLCLVMKQQAVFFLAFGLLALLLPYFLKKPVHYVPAVIQSIMFTAGAILPYLLLIILFRSTGSFDKFWFWTVQYAAKYASGLPIQQAPMQFTISFVPMWKEFSFIWISFAVGFLLLFFGTFSVKQKLLAIGFAIFSVLTICPGFYFRQHYFVSLLPAVGLLSAITFSVLSSGIARWLKLKQSSFLLPVVIAFCLVIVVLSNQDYYLQAEPEEITKTFYTTNPFVEAVGIGDFIKQNSSPSDQIAVIGSEPEIYFYAKRFAATGYIYTYGLVERHSYNLQMQKEMISEVEKAKPEFVVYSNVDLSWLYYPGAPRLIYKWSEQYTQQYYDLVGIVDELGPDQTIYKWNEDAKSYQTQGKDYIKIYKKK